MNEDRSSSAAQVSEPRRSGMGDDLKANVCDSKATGVLYREKKKTTSEGAMAGYD